LLILPLSPYSAVKLNFRLILNSTFQAEPIKRKWIILMGRDTKNYRLEWKFKIFSRKPKILGLRLLLWPLKAASHSLVFASVLKK